MHRQEENVAAVRTMFGEFAARRDERTMRILDEEIAWDARALPLPALQGVFHGHAGVRAFWRAWFDAFDRVEFFDGPHHHANGNQVISWWRSRQLGRTSGLDVPHEFGVVFTFQSGRVVHAAAFTSRDDTLRAGGLEP